MKAMILAAGRGARMRPLTDVKPKPLITVQEKPLIVYHIERLIRWGVREVVINVSYLGSQIMEALGDGSQWQISIQFSQEPEPLETAGGIIKALPYLKTEKQQHAKFFCINGDIWTEIEREDLPKEFHHLAHLVLVPNPEHHLQGDFGLQQQNSTTQVTTNGSYGQVILPQSNSSTFTFSGVSVLDTLLFSEYKEQSLPLLKVLSPAIERGEVFGQLYQGRWCDVGTVERLQRVQSWLK